MEDHEDAKGSPPRRSTPPSRTDQVDSDMALAESLQQQERDSTMLSTINSENEEEEEFSDYASEDEDEDEEEYEDNNNDPDYECFSSQGLEPESGFFQGEDSNTDLEMEEDDIDPDEMSYEELMELGEIIGEERRGLSLDQISKCLIPHNGQSTKTGIDRCVICQVEYGEGEKMVALPCAHPYHSDCISQWLQLKRTCPICSTEVPVPPKVSRIV